MKLEIIFSVLSGEASETTITSAASFKLLRSFKLFKQAGKYFSVLKTGITIERLVPYFRIQLSYIGAKIVAADDVRIIHPFNFSVF